MSSASENEPPRMPPRVPTPPRRRRPAPDRHHYGTTHQKLREQLLRLHPVCQACGSAWATAAHHKVYPARSIEDYQALCEQCHIDLHHRG